MSGMAGLPISNESSGVWTPALTLGPHIYGAGNAGAWYRVGAIVYLDFSLVVSTRNASLTTQNIIVSGLPFSKKSSPNTYSVGTFFYNGLTLTSEAVLSLVASNTQCRLFYKNSGLVPYSAAASAFQIYGSIVYATN